MQYLKVEKIKFSYENQTENLFANVSLEISERTKAGLIGKNGSGKSTLLNILQKKLKPIDGFLYFRKNIHFGFLPQELNLPENFSINQFLWKTKLRLFELKTKIDYLENFNNKEIAIILADYEKYHGYKFETTIDKNLSKFGFSGEILFRKISTLSGGEKTKLALCQILLQEPDVLLLDEPTNHLDIDALQWLENFLHKIKIPFLIISHDRKFLDNCVNTILELKQDGLNTYSGNYSFYKNEREEELHRKVHLYEQQNREIKKLEYAARKRKQWAFSHQTETGKDGYAPIYECISNPAKHAMKQAKNLENRLDRDIKKAEEEKPFIEKERKIQFHSPHIRSRMVLQIENLKKNFGSQTVFKDINLIVKTSSRLAVIGKNGSGKSTLLKIITNRIDPTAGNCCWSPQVKIGYYSQNYENLNLENTIIDEIGNGKKTNQTYARTVLGCLNVDAKLINQKIKTLSIGERSKVALAKIIVSNPNVLVLDEPTNHLEISARESLEDALVEFDGTIIFASHDRYLIEKLATEKLRLVSQ